MVANIKKTFYTDNPNVTGKTAKVYSASHFLLWYPLLNISWLGNHSLRTSSVAIVSHIKVTVRNLTGGGIKPVKELPQSLSSLVFKSLYLNTYLIFLKGKAKRSRGSPRSEGSWEFCSLT